MTDVLVSRRLFNPTGGEVESHAEAVATPQAGTQIARLELRNGSVSFTIEAQVDPNTYPFKITGGTITSGICGAPWNITGGHLGQDMRLDATRAGSGSCANTITVVGEQQGPPSWREPPTWARV